MSVLSTNAPCVCSVAPVAVVPTQSAAGSAPGMSVQVGPRLPAPAPGLVAPSGLPAPSYLPASCLAAPVPPRSRAIAPDQPGFGPAFPSPAPPSGGTSTSCVGPSRVVCPADPPVASLVGDQAAADPGLAPLGSSSLPVRPLCPPRQADKEAHPGSRGSRRLDPGSLPFVPAAVRNLPCTTSEPGQEVPCPRPPSPVLLPANAASVSPCPDDRSLVCAPPCAECGEGWFRFRTASPRMCCANCERPHVLSPAWSELSLPPVSLAVRARECATKASGEVAAIALAVLTEAVARLPVMPAAPASLSSTPGLQVPPVALVCDESGMVWVVLSDLSCRPHPVCSFNRYQLLLDRVWGLRAWPGSFDRLNLADFAATVAALQRPGLGLSPLSVPPRVRRWALLAGLSGELFASALSFPHQCSFFCSSHPADLKFGSDGPAFERSWAGLSAVAVPPPSLPVCLRAFEFALVAAACSPATRILLVVPVSLLAALPVIPAGLGLCLCASVPTSSLAGSPANSGLVYLAFGVAPRLWSASPFPAGPAADPASPMSYSPLFHPEAYVLPCLPASLLASGTPFGAPPCPAPGPHLNLLTQRGDIPESALPPVPPHPAFVFAPRFCLDAWPLDLSAVTRFPSLLRASGLRPPWSHPFCSPFSEVQSGIRPAALHLVFPPCHPDAPFLYHVARFGAPRLSSVRPQRSVYRNHKSSSDHPAFVRQWASEELGGGRVLRLHQGHSACVPLIVSPLGVIPKPTPGKFRPISDFSWGGHEGSANGLVDYSPLDPCEMASVARVVARVLFLRQTYPGIPVHIAKFDVDAAYRRVPVARRWCWTTAHRVGPDVFMHRVLAFGDKVAAHVYCRYTNALSDVVCACGFWVALYVDDGIVVDIAPLCPLALSVALGVFRHAGQPISQRKLEEAGPPGPACEVLGVTIDAESLVLTLSESKRHATLTKVSRALSGHRASVSSLASLVGSLRWLADLVPLGRFFVRSVERDMYAAKSRGLSSLVLSRMAREDLSWWSLLLQSSLPPVRVVRPHECLPVEVWTDACPVGFGGHWADQHFRGCWLPSEVDTEGVTNNEFELAAVVLAAWIWGPAWSGRRVALGCDNMVSVAVSSRGYAANLFASRLLRLLAAAQLRFRFALHLQHVPGVDNDKADWLSRWSRYGPLFLQACPHSTRRQLKPLIRRLDDWTSSPSLRVPPLASGEGAQPLLESGLGPSGVWPEGNLSSLPSLFVLPPSSRR